MAARTELMYSPLSGRIYWGRYSGEGVVTSSGKNKDVTSEFLQIMEQKFPVNTTQNVSVNGENKYRVIVVDMERKVLVDGKEV